MLVERACGDPFRQGLGELHGRSLDDVARQAVDLAIVHGLRQVVGGSCWSQVEVQLVAHYIRLAVLLLGVQRSVAAVEADVRKTYPVLATLVFSLAAIPIRMP